MIYVIWKKRGLKEQEEEGASFVPSALIPSEGIRRRLPKIIATVLIAVALIYGANFTWHKFASRNTSGTAFATQTVNDLTVKLFSPGGQLKSGDNEVLIEFLDTGGQPVDVGKVKFEANMNMTGMQMNEGATIQPAGTPGLYRAKVKVGMAGDWTAKLSYEGPQGKGEKSFSMSVK